jgi:hypothetical protein
MRLTHEADDVGTGEILHPPGPEQWDDAASDAPFIDVDSGHLLWSPLLAEDEAVFRVLEISLVQFLDGDRLQIELALFGRVVALRYPVEQNVRPARGRCLASRRSRQAGSGLWVNGNASRPKRSGLRVPKSAQHLVMGNQ